MDDATRGTTWFLAAQLVFVAAFIHLSLGLLNWLQWLQAGFVIPRDLRWPAFVLSGLVVIGGLLLANRAEDRRPYYLVGIVIMLGYVVGYFGWHYTGHRPLLVLGTGIGTETLSVQWFLDHLFAGLVEFVAVTVETMAAVLLAVLYVDAR